MDTYSVFDTSVLSYNIGNEIIMDAVMYYLHYLFPNDFIIKIPIEDIGKRTRMYNQISRYSFVGGTNALNGNIRKYRQWDLSLHNLLLLKNVILMGCGWVRYENRLPSKYTKWGLDRILSKNIMHSVRDDYTLKKCLELNLKGVKFINTGCPTLWSLTPDHLKKIPNKKSDSAVFTITDYNPNPQRDYSLLSQLQKCYSKIYFFPQGVNDIAYLSGIQPLDGIEIIKPRLTEFDKVIKNGADYIGTRLHAGIRALQLGRRSIIIGIDNRALEMGKNFSLPVINQVNIDTLSELINDNYSLKINLPWENINMWLTQFRKQ